MLDKVLRIQNTVNKLSLALGMDENMNKVVQDAASLAMADLATAVVTEFTSLSGVMARHYALRDGYSEQVCLGVGYIFPVYLCTRASCGN